MSNDKPWDAPTLAELESRADALDQQLVGLRELLSDRFVLLKDQVHSLRQELAECQQAVHKLSARVYQLETEVDSETLRYDPES